MIPNLIYNVKTNPELVIPKFNLVYATPDLLSISRSINGDKVKYYHGKSQINNPDKIEALNALKIPPAWQDVRISSLDNTHILATGYDAKHRKQYRYHNHWVALKNQTKFYKMISFAETLPKLRKRVVKDIEQPNWCKTKVLAIIIRLLEESHIRIGNTYYAKQNKTYGISTLRTRHLHLFKNKFKLEFIGKRGKKHTVTIRNKKLLRLINKCEEIPGWELFQYFDDNGDKHSINSTMVNNYIHDTCGQLFTAKDFRTWGASLIAYKTLKQQYEENQATKPNKAIKKAVDTAAKALNNTPAVSKKYYVHPHILTTYIDKTIVPYFNMADHLSETSETELQPIELSLVHLIENYKPKILKNYEI